MELIGALCAEPPPAENAPFRRVNLSQGATFDVLRAEMGNRKSEVGEG